MIDAKYIGAMEVAACTAPGCGGKGVLHKGAIDSLWGVHCSLCDMRVYGLESAVDAAEAWGRFVMRDAGTEAE